MCCDIPVPFLSLDPSKRPRVWLEDDVVDSVEGVMGVWSNARMYLLFNSRLQLQSLFYYEPLS